MKVGPTLIIGKNITKTDLAMKIAPRIEIFDIETSDAENKPNSKTRHKIGRNCIYLLKGLKLRSYLDNLTTQQLSLIAVF